MFQKEVSTVTLHPSIAVPPERCGQLCMLLLCKQFVSRVCSQNQDMFLIPLSTVTTM